MAYTVELQPGEEVLVQIGYQPAKHTEGFTFAASNQALFLPATRFVISGDPRYFQRVPVEQVRAVRIEAVKPYGFYIFAVLMAVVGLILLWSITLPEARYTPRGIGCGLAIVAGAILLPIAGRGRYRLIIHHDGGKYRWVPPLVVDSGAKRRVNEILDAIAQVSESLRIPVRDDRNEGYKTGVMDDIGPTR